MQLSHFSLLKCSVKVLQRKLCVMPAVTLFSLVSNKLRLGIYKKRMRKVHCKIPAPQKARKYLHSHGWNFCYQHCIKWRFMYGYIWILIYRPCSSLIYLCIYLLKLFHNYSPRFVSNSQAFLWKAHWST